MMEENSKSENDEIVNNLSGKEISNKYITSNKYIASNKYLSESTNKDFLHERHERHSILKKDNNMIHMNKSINDILFEKYFPKKYNKSFVEENTASQKANKNSEFGNCINYNEYKNEFYRNSIQIEGIFEFKQYFCYNNFKNIVKKKKNFFSKNKHNFSNQRRIHFSKFLFKSKEFKKINSNLSVLKSGILKFTQQSKKIIKSHTKRN